jgi:predicted dehydrogenase
MFTRRDRRHRQTPAALLAKQIIARGDIGEPVRFRGTFDQGFYNDPGLRAGGHFTDPAHQKLGDGQGMGAEVAKRPAAAEGFRADYRPGRYWRTGALSRHL